MIDSFFSEGAAKLPCWQRCNKLQRLLAVWLASRVKGSLQVTDAGAAELVAAAQHTAKLEAAEKLVAANVKHCKPDARLKSKIDELQARAWDTLRLNLDVAVTEESLRGTTTGLASWHTRFRKTFRE